MQIHFLASRKTTALIMYIDSRYTTKIKNYSYYLTPVETKNHHIKYIMYNIIH